MEDEAIRNLAVISQASGPVAPRAQHVLTRYERTEAPPAKENVRESGAAGAGAEEDAGEADVAVTRADGVPESESVNVWPDDTAESAFLSEARERGEPAKASRAAVEDVEEREDAKALPRLDELVEKLPVETRELLDELFRVKFVAVRRVRKADLKS